MEIIVHELETNPVSTPARDQLHVGTIEIEVSMTDASGQLLHLQESV